MTQYMTHKQSKNHVKYVHKPVSNHSWDKSDLDSVVNVKTFDVGIDLEKILHATLLDPNIGFGSAECVFTTVTKNDTI